MNVASLHRTLDQELVALLRGASLECLACGEFVMHARGGNVFCPECGSQLADVDTLFVVRRNDYSAERAAADDAFLTANAFTSTANWNGPLDTVIMYQRTS